MARRSALVSWVCTALVLGSAPAAFASTAHPSTHPVRHTVSRHHHAHHRHVSTPVRHLVSRRLATVKPTRTPAPAVTVTPAPVVTPTVDPALVTTPTTPVTAAPVDTTAPVTAAPVDTTAPTTAAPATAAPVDTAAPVAPAARLVAPVEVAITPGILTSAQMTQALDLAKAAGASTIYSVLNWSALQPTGPNAYDWDASDRLVAGAQSRGLGLRFQLTSTPDWAHPDLVAAGVEEWQRKMTPPTGTAQLAQWKTFVGDVATRYGSAVARMEMWNEPNIPEFFRPAPNAAQYVQVLKAGYEAVKAVAPQVQVLFAGLSRNDVGYLQQFYAAADAVPGVPANHWFDVLDVHPYCGNRAPSYNSSTQVWNGPNGLMDENFLGFQRMHDVMLSHGEDKHVFLGEFGYSTVSNQWTTATTDAARAGYLTEAYRLAGAVSYVDGMNWYSFIANQWDGSEWTLLSSTFAPTATYDALVALPK